VLLSEFAFGIKIIYHRQPKGSLADGRALLLFDANKSTLFVRAAWEKEEFLFQTASDEEIVCFCSKWATLYTTQPHSIKKQCSPVYCPFIWAEHFSQ